MKKNLITVLKILVSIVLLVVVFYQINWQQLKQILAKANYFYLVIALLLFVLSQAVSVLRLDLFFRTININMNYITHAKLYVLGMFYNFFIPGGIGGDAYKVIILNKAYKSSVKELTQAVFLDRLMGLLAIVLLLIVLFFNLVLPIPNYWKWLVLGLGIIGLIIAIFLLRKIFPKQKKNYVLAFTYAIIIQLLQVYSIVFILKSLGNTTENITYIVLFLASSILSIFSFAGIGVRESIFYYGGKWFNFDVNLSVSVAFLFSIITALVSLFGVVFIFKKIDLTENN